MVFLLAASWRVCIEKFRVLSLGAGIIEKREVRDE